MKSKLSKIQVFLLTFTARLIMIQLQQSVQSAK
jgi:hypothetical protein